MGGMWGLRDCKGRARVLGRTHRRSEGTAEKGYICPFVQTEEESSWHSVRPFSWSSEFRLVCGPLTWWESTVDKFGISNVSLGTCLYTKANVKINIWVLSTL